MLESTNKSGHKYNWLRQKPVQVSYEWLIRISYTIFMLLFCSKLVMHSYELVSQSYRTCGVVFSDQIDNDSMYIQRASFNLNKTKQNKLKWLSSLKNRQEASLVYRTYNTELKGITGKTRALTAALDQLRVVASSTLNDLGLRSGQHQQTRPMSSSTCCNHVLRGRPGWRFQSAAGSRK